MSYLDHGVSSFLSSTPIVPTATAIFSSALIPSTILLNPTSTGSTPSAASNSTSHENVRPGAENGECKLLGPFALFIQGALGLLALLSLVYKRWRERPQRPVKIWAFDASKQVVGSALLHVANLFMSILSSGELKPKADDYQANPCSFYLLNLAIDTTLGIPILILLLRLFTYFFSLTPFGSPPESIQSGNYGRPPKTKWWLKQCLIYFLGLLCMKICVYVIFNLCPWIIKLGDWALRWTEGNETVQVFFVMLFFPLVMNALQYYIIDGFIKNKNPDEHEESSSLTESEDSDEHGYQGRSSREPDSNRSLNGHDETEAVKDNADVRISEQTGVPPSSQNALPQDKAKTLDEYDPALDGEETSGRSSPTMRKPAGSLSSERKDRH